MLAFSTAFPTWTIVVAWIDVGTHDETKHKKKQLIEHKSQMNIIMLHKSAYNTSLLHVLPRHIITVGGVHGHIIMVAFFLLDLRLLGLNKMHNL